ncbi:hypothetical protein R8Z50_34215 [Longispora sp. K20-0274]|uniref:hypothetical protein n=1 Tax=Longispora sp. K20-0274 TaxID=3088255 RepID=UPI00399B2CA4
MTSGDGQSDEPMWPMVAPQVVSGVPVHGDAGDRGAGRVDPGPVVPDAAAEERQRSEAVAGGEAGAFAGSGEGEASVVGATTGLAGGGQGRRRPRGKVIALVAGIAVIVAVVVAGGIALRVYDEQTKIDRSTPTLVVSQLVDAMFTARDEPTVARFSCKKADLGALRALLADLKEREGRFNTQFRVTATNLQQAGQSTVQADLELSAMGTEDTQRWTFETANQDGWRVCSARTLT